MSNQFCKDHAPIPHTEAMCHATGEKRQNLINKLKMYLDQADDRPCLVKDGRQTSRRNPIIKYPGYVDYHHPAFKPQKLEDCLQTVPQPKMMDHNCTHGNNFEHIDQMQTLGQDHPSRPTYDNNNNQWAIPKGQYPIPDCPYNVSCNTDHPAPCCRNVLDRLCEEMRKHHENKDQPLFVHGENLENMRHGSRNVDLYQENQPEYFCPHDYD